MMKIKFTNKTICKVQLNALRNLLSLLLVITR